MITSLLPAQPETRICLRLHMRGLHPVYLVQCLFLLYSLFLCVAYSCAVVDEKDHTTGAIQFKNKMKTYNLGKLALMYFLGGISALHINF
jgi:hypothetical protein